MLSTLAAVALSAPAPHDGKGVGGLQPQHATVLQSAPGDTCSKKCNGARDDPLFTYNGNTTHFWIKKGTLTPLLEWQHHGRHMVLSGKTYGRPGSNNQWFHQFVLTQGQQTVIDIKADERGIMKIKRDQGLLTKVSYKLDSGKDLLQKELPDNLDMWKGLKISTGDVTMRLYSAKAAKFKTPEEQLKYTHLNIEFQGEFPASAKGIFAELAGVQPMTKGTRALTTVPKRFLQIDDEVALLSETGDCICPGPKPIDCIPDGEEANLLDFSKAIVELNNLGGYVDSKKDPYLVLDGVGELDGEKLKLRVQATTPYKPNNYANTGIVRGMLSINMDTPNKQDTDYPADTTLPKGDDFYTMNTAKIKFTFLDQQDNPVKLPKSTVLTVLDIDHAARQPMECVTAYDVSGYALSPKSQVKAIPGKGQPTSAVRLCADTETGTANVKNPVHGKPLTEEQKSVGATFLLEDVTSFEFQLHSSCCSNNGRNFFFEGQTTMTPPPCKKIE